MKLIVAIVQNDDADTLIDALTQADFRATRLASTGGFLRQGNTTVILGVADAQVEQALALIGSNTQSVKPEPGNGRRSNNSKNMNQVPVLPPEALFAATALEAGREVITGRATVFVLDLERYEHI